jgi:hypothetical protein
MGSHNVAASMHCPVSLDSVDGVVAEMAAMIVAVPVFCARDDGSD